MRVIPDQLRSKNLIPFKRRHDRYKIPGMTPEDEGLDRVDADLSPEEEGYIRHYLGYADALIKRVEENVLSELREVGPSEERLEQQRPAELDTELANESNPATEDRREKAA
jgi:hypothetical protein